MKNEREIIAYLTISKRLPTSTNGNPRWLVLLKQAKRNGVTESVLACTAVDSSLAYSITNHTGHTVRALIGEHYNRTTIADVENLARGNETAHFQAIADREGEA